MLSIEAQINAGKLVCPVSHRRLYREGAYLRTIDTQFEYPLIKGVPVLLPDQERQEKYLTQEDGAMAREYASSDGTSSVEKFLRHLANLGGDYRSKEAREAFSEAVGDQNPDTLCLSVGGGPGRAHPNLVNLNIGLFANVDIVGDAHSLPYEDRAVDAIFCEAVLEHLEYPERAVSEMYRVLRVGGQVFAATPFLQPFHAYPNHFQNFTLIGHRRLFERAGFEIVSSGVCVGPTFALSQFVASYARAYVPTWVLSRLVWLGVRLVALPIRPLDIWVNRHPQAHLLASTTYVQAAKG